MFIVSGFVFSGCCISSFQRKKTETLAEIVMFVVFIQNRLRYECLPLPSLLAAAEENGKFRRLSFVSSCREKTEKGNPFPVSWRESIEDDKELCSLLKGIVSNLVRMGEDLGTTDLDGQLSCCGYYEGVFRSAQSESEEKSKKYSKLYPALGAMLGLWAAILII